MHIVSIQLSRKKEKKKMVKHINSENMIKSARRVAMATSRLRAFLDIRLGLKKIFKKKENDKNISLQII